MAAIRRCSVVHAGLAALLVGAVAAGCGSEDVGPAADSAPMASTSTPAATRTPGPTSRSPETTVAEPGFTPLPLAAVGLSIPSDCPTPWLPVYAQDEVSYPSSQPPTEVPPVDGSPIPDLESLGFQPPDSDGDGAPDEVLEAVDGGTAYALRRSDGDLVLAVEGGSVGAPGGAAWVGDLDGDGRDELLLFVAEGDGVDRPLYVVPGSTPAGRHDPRSIGVELPVAVGGPVSGLGDLDGDGAGDLLLRRGDDDRLTVLSGAVVMDAAGGAVPADARPLASLPGDVRTALLLGDGRAVPVRLIDADGDPGATDLVLVTDPPVVLRTAREQLDVSTAFAARITAFENVDGRHVQLATPDTRSGTRLVLAWNLDDPCAGPTPAG